MNYFSFINVILGSLKYEDLIFGIIIIVSDFVIVDVYYVFLLVLIMLLSISSCFIKFVFYVSDMKLKGMLLNVLVFGFKVVVGY